MIEVYVEVATRRVFAGAVEWPGWTRAGRDEQSALTALIRYGDRYRAAIGEAGRLPLPRDERQLKIVERIAGDATTDFGAPGKVPQLDQQPIVNGELERLVAIHDACWRAFLAASARAAGHDLAPSGPRGGGRSVEGIVDHVVGAELAYRRSIGGAALAGGAHPTDVRDAFAAQLRERAAGHVADVGPRGGRRWPVRYAVRRSCWHLLDHAWEIEDRLEP